MKRLPLSQVLLAGLIGLATRAPAQTQPAAPQPAPGVDTLWGLEG